MTETLRLKRPQLLTDLACERIREAIVGGEFKLGEQMSEAQLRSASASARHRCARPCCA